DGRVPAHGGRPRPRGRWHHPPARRPERPSPVAVLGRGTRGLGAGSSVAVPARSDGAHAGARAALSVRRPHGTAPTPRTPASPPIQATSAHWPHTLPGTRNTPM